MADKTVSVVDRSHDRPTTLLLKLRTSAVLVAGACTPLPQRTPTDSVSAPTSAPTSPTATSTAIGTPATTGPTTDSGIPVAARVDSIDGAEEFVTYFLVQLDRMRGVAILDEENAAWVSYTCRRMLGGTGAADGVRARC